MFYVSQPNVLMIKLVSVVFFVTVSVALGGVLLIIKWTYDYPLIRLAASVALFFCAIYLMRVLGKLGLAFFVVALAVIYAQTFPSMTSQSEILVRLLLWLWVAINTAILVTLLVNACFQQAFPGNQFKARLAEMLQAVASRLADPDAEAPPTFGETAAQFNQLQSLFAQASRATPEIAADPQAWRSRLAATLRCYQLAALLQADEADSDDRLRLSQAVLQLKSALSEGPFDGAIPPLALSGRGVNRAVLQEMAALLQRLAQGEPVALPQGEVEKPPLLAPDAWRNPAYLHFALKTLLATLICYVFYTAADWQGLHTIMLSCVIVAQPGLGATMQKTWLRIGGALFATLLALLLIVFVQPWTDSLSGLLAMSLPVLALAAWIAAGSERIAYAGIQIGFTFALAFLSWFGPLTNLTELRDRGAGYPARGAGLLHCPFISLAGQRSAAAEIAPRRTLSPAGGLPRRPARCGAAGPSVCRLHRQRSAYPSGSRRTAGHVCPPLAPGEKLADARHPRPGRGDRPPQRRIPAQRRAGDPTLARCAEQLRRYAERIEQEATAPAEPLATDLTNPFGPALAAALATLPDWARHR
ncbi:tripartite multidrug resistance system membrane fusion protein [Klebsiella quasipneumoniae]|nr:tripartite multidrug resistance system membrane fusion protein [Klebsiella quasipneumoniae]